MDDRYRNGVSHYTIVEFRFRKAFPGDAPCCKYCHVLRYEPGLRRYICEATQEWILEPEIGVGNSCPGEIIEEE